MQKTALRILSFSEFRAHTSPIFKEHKILKLHDHIVLENCLFIHDFINKKLPSCFNNYFKTIECSYQGLTTRNSKIGSIYVPRANTTKYGLNSIKYKAISSWNNLAKQLNNNGTNILTLSRKALKKHILETFINSY